ncbi:FAD-binding protein, partial [bacterium]|nr:FAD-binding protein [bacterium]
MNPPPPTAPAWSNWSGGVRCEPREILRPRDEDEVVRAVRRAAETGAVLRTAGSGHSFSPVVATDGVLVSLEEWTGLESVDAAARRATIRAGTRLSALGEPLRAHGLALANQGDVDVQSLGGAIGTGTHGTGPTLGSLSTQVVAVRLATADGRVRTWDEGDGERLDAARVSLGLFGVAIAYTLQLVPAYRLHERTWRGGVEDAMARLDENVAAHRHYEFFWWPSRDLVEHKSLDPTELPVGAAVGPRERVDWSDRVFPSVRDLRFEEMEVAVPA